MSDEDARLDRARLEFEREIRIRDKAIAACTADNTRIDRERYDTTVRKLRGRLKTEAADAKICRERYALAIQALEARCAAYEEEAMAMRRRAYAAENERDAAQVELARERRRCAPVNRVEVKFHGTRRKASQDVVDLVGQVYRNGVRANG